MEIPCGASASGERGRILVFVRWCTCHEQNRLPTYARGQARPGQARGHIMWCWPVQANTPEEFAGAHNHPPPKDALTASVPSSWGSSCQAASCQEGSRPAGRPSGRPWGRCPAWGRPLSLVQMKPPPPPACLKAAPQTSSSSCAQWLCACSTHCAAAELKGCHASGTCHSSLREHRVGHPTSGNQTSDKMLRLAVPGPPAAGLQHAQSGTRRCRRRARAPQAARWLRGQSAGAQHAMQHLTPSLTTVVSRHG